MERAMGIEPTSDAWEERPDPLFFPVMLRPRYGIQFGDCYVQFGPGTIRTSRIKIPLATKGISVVVWHNPYRIAVFAALSPVASVKPLVASTLLTASRIFWATIWLG